MNNSIDWCSYPGLCQSSKR
uniref:Uncharacterized protein MANES_04G136000 n=1 Tax=Rhizophora mucronata TaxID=61149 RepID=A0A2P2MWY3_RHIMU